MNRTGAILLWALAGLLLLAPAPASPGDGLFSVETPLELELTASWAEINRRKDDRRYPATLAWTDARGQRQSIAITVEVRGRSRRELCRFPPLRLRFDADQPEHSPFHSQRALKLVTQCDYGARWERYLVHELLAYQLYNDITDYSFRVRPLQVDYLDSRRGRSDGQRPAFLIEDERALARRLGLDRVRENDFHPAQLDPESMSRLALFQWLIGNLDWSVLSSPGDRRCCHNARLLGPDPATGLYHPVPYDFDAAGLVNTHYSMPPAHLRMRNIRERRYRGFCRHASALPQARAELLARESRLLARLEVLDELGRGHRQASQRYLEEFFDLLRDPRRVEQQVTASCRN